MWKRRRETAGTWRHPRRDKALEKLTIRNRRDKNAHLVKLCHRLDPNRCFRPNLSFLPRGVATPTSGLVTTTTTTATTTTSSSSTFLSTRTQVLAACHARRSVPICRRLSSGGEAFRGHVSPTLGLCPWSIRTKKRY